MNVKPLGIAAALAILASSGFAQNTSGPLETPVYWRNILDTTLFSGKACTNYNTAYFNAITGDIVRCRNTAGFTTSLAGVWTTVSGGGGGSSVWGGITGTLSNQTDLQAALNAKQNSLTLPLSVANGGTGTTTPALVAGTGISITGTWPAQTITNTGGGGGGMANPMTTTGDIIIGGSSGTPARLAAGTNNYVLTMTSGSPAWQPSAGGGSGIPSGTALPGTCTTGASFIKTNNSPNQQLYICSTTDTWTQNMLLGGTGALTINGTTGALDIVTGVVPRLTAANPFTGRNSFSGPMDFVMTGTPPAGASSKLTLYANNDGSLHYVNFAGTDATLSTGAGFASPMTTQDDIIVGGASGTPARLAKGADSQVLGIDPGTHHLTYINQSGGGGGGTPGGSTNQIQFNNSGSFAGHNFCLYPDTTVAGTVVVQDRLVYNPVSGCSTPADADPMFSLSARGSSAVMSLQNVDPANFTQMYLANDDMSHVFQIGIGNTSAGVPELVDKPFMYDGSTGGKGVMWDIDMSGSTTDIRTFGTSHLIPQSADPGCSTVNDSGKMWMDSTTSTTHHLKVCSWTSSAAAWVTVF